MKMLLRFVTIALASVLFRCFGIHAMPAIDVGGFEKALGSFVANGQSLNATRLLFNPASLKNSDLNRYIIKLRDGLKSDVVKQVQDTVKLLPCSIVHEFQTIFDGFTINIPLPNHADVIALLAKIPHIESIERDFRTKSYQVQPLENHQWGLDRLDQSRLPLDSKYLIIEIVPANYLIESYTFDRTGKDVNIYVIDSGVDINHQEFSGRARHAYVANFLKSDAEDCSGHGTHVAAIAAGLNTGVAKQANIHSIRVIGCNDDSLNSEIINAIEWISRNHRKPAIISMSLGPRVDDDGTYPRSELMDAAIATAIRTGITVIVAAGNDNRDCCTGSPAGTQGVITVAASNEEDQRASFSNYGPCVSLFAPGNNIVSAKPGNRYVSKRGTSQATPFAAGVAALYLEANPAATPSEVMAALKQAAAQNTIGNVATAPNLFLQSISIPPKDSDRARLKLVDLKPVGTVRPDDMIFGLSRETATYVFSATGLVALVLIAAGIVVWRRKSKFQPTKQSAMPNLSPFPSSPAISPSAVWYTHDVQKSALHGPIIIPSLQTPGAVYYPGKRRVSLVLLPPAPPLPPKSIPDASPENSKPSSLRSLKRALEEEEEELAQEDAKRPRTA